MTTMLTLDNRSRTLVDEEFVELMCADHDLLDAEFDAIVAGLSLPVDPSGTAQQRGSTAQPRAGAPRSRRERSQVTPKRRRSRRRRVPPGAVASADTWIAIRAQLKGGDRSALVAGSLTGSTVRDPAM